MLNTRIVAEIDQKANPDPRCLQIIHKLGPVGIVQIFHGFELDNDAAEAQTVCAKKLI